MKTALAAAIIVLAAVACASAPPTAEPLSLDGREFVSVRVLEGGRERQLVPGTAINVGFADGQVALQAGCNHIGGPYRVDGGRLLAPELSMTAIGCDPPRHAQDEWLSGFIASAPGVTLSGSGLVLEAAGVRLELDDRRAVHPDADLVGPVWTLVTLVEAGTASSIPVGVDATIQLVEDGTLTLDTGCNTGGGTYVIEGGPSLRVSDVFLTRRGCPGAADDVETFVLGVLNAGSLEYAVDGRSLTFTAGQRALVFHVTDRP